MNRVKDYFEQPEGRSEQARQLDESFLTSAEWSADVTRAYNAGVADERARSRRQPVKIRSAVGDMLFGMILGMIVGLVMGLGAN